MRYALVVVGMSLLAAALSLTPGLARAADRSSATAEQQVAALSIAVRVCCKKGRHDWWSNLRECRREGGRAVERRQCRDDTARVCCKKGRRDWWTSWRECRRADGYVVPNRACRRD